MNCLFFDLETDGRRIHDAACCTVDGDVCRVDTSALLSEIGNADILVGHNIKSWDIPILKSLHPYGWPSKAPRIWDTMEMEAVLSPLAGNLALPVTHDAPEDTRAVRRLFLSQVRRLQEAGLQDIVVRILGITFPEVPDSADAVVPPFPPTPQRRLNLALDAEKRSLILAPRILWPFLTDIRGLTFHYSAQLDDIVDTDYTPVRKPEYIFDMATLFAGRFVDACSAAGLSPMVFLTPDFFRYRLRYGGVPYLHLLDLGSAVTSADRRLLCVDPSDLTADIEEAYDDVICVEPDYASLCCERIVSRDIRLPEGVSIRRIGDCAALADGTLIRKADFDRYHCVESPYRLKRTARTVFLPQADADAIPEVGPDAAGLFWTSAAEAVLSCRTPLVLAVVHHESDIPFLLKALRRKADGSFNIPQGYIPERKSLHKYVDLATRDRARTGIVITESSALAACRFVCDIPASIILCDDDIFGIRRRRQDDRHYDAVARVTTAVLRSAFPRSTVLKSVARSTADDFVISEPTDSPDIIKKKIRDRLIGGGAFRGGQEPFLDAVLRGGNHFISLPTGTGKSLLFQGPAFFATNRLSVVFSPLKALINDQVMELEAAFGKDCGVDYLHGDHCSQDIYDSIRTGRTRLLYATPDQFVRGRLADALRYRFDHDGGAGYIVFDEAHCISLWGRDFRPAYLHAALGCTSMFPNGRYLFLSATLPAGVRDDISDIISSQIRFDDTDTSEMSDGCLNDKIVPHCIRIPCQDVPEDDAQFQSWKPFEPHFEKVEELVRGSGLDLNSSCIAVFFDDQKGTEELSRRLRSAFPEYADRICHYHASLPEQQKGELQSLVKNGGVSIIVCTKALGMGVNIGNIHMVIHVKRPATVEDYLQEIGRAGRNPGLMEREHIQKIHAYCLDVSEKKGPENIVTWENVEAAFKDFSRSGKGVGSEFRYHLHKGAWNENAESRFENILFHLKRMHRITAAPIRGEFMARVISRQPDNAEMNPAALSLLQYLAMRNDGGTCRMVSEDAASFIREHTERSVDLSLRNFENKAEELQKKGFILTCRDILYRLPEDSPSLAFYDSADKIIRLFLCVALRCGGHDAEFIRERENERKIRDDARKVFNLLPEGADYDFNRLVRSFAASLTDVRTQGSLGGPHLLSAPDDFSSISSDDLLYRHILPVLILRKLGFIKPLNTADYAVTVLDDTPLGQAPGDDGVRLRLEARNSLKRIKQEICRRLMEHLADDDGFDMDTFTKDYYRLTLSAGTTKEEMLASFSAFLDRYPSVRRRDD